MLMDSAWECNSLVEWGQPTLAGSGCELHCACVAGTFLSQVGSWTYLGAGRDFTAKSEVCGRAMWTLHDAPLQTHRPTAPLKRARHN